MDKPWLWSYTSDIIKDIEKYLESLDRRNPTSLDIGKDGEIEVEVNDYDGYHYVFLDQKLLEYMDKLVKAQKQYQKDLREYEEAYNKA